LNVDPRDVTNDRHGFAVYGVFAIAGQAQVSAISELRRAMYSGVEDPPAYVNAPAHVTVKRLFSGIPNVEDIQEAVHGLAESTKPFRIEFAGDPESSGGGNSSLAVPVKSTSELVTVNTTLESAIGQIVETEYRPIEFQPHMTVFQDADEDESERGLRLTKGLRLGTGFHVETLELMARTAPLRGGRWQSLGSFELDIWS
jgi:2'-5' RNA ligase|tara:strand:- start:156 stop:755 length:600 start_codon:yes stop_codon:yes gene_type:complete